MSHCVGVFSFTDPFLFLTNLLVQYTWVESAGKGAIQLRAIHLRPRHSPRDLSTCCPRRNRGYSCPPLGLLTFSLFPAPAPDCSGAKTVGISQRALG